MVNTTTEPITLTKVKESRVCESAREQLDVAIIGAGPYGLSAAAHLKARGLEVCVFGQPMDFWASKMPKGMLLRSPRVASTISDPMNAFTLEACSSPSFYVC
jgi:cation diffusion facilitator CzcD-associated flavoprotein CzcO